MRNVIRSVFVLALALIMTLGTLPMEVSAASTKKKPKATNVEYYEDANNKKTGIKSFFISPNTYYNISRDPAVNPSITGDNPSPTIDLTVDTLKNIAVKHIFPRWGVIAEGIFRDQASQLVTIEGSGMMSSTKDANESFDKHFSYKRKGVPENYHEYKWALEDLASTLGNPPSKGGKSTTDMPEFAILQGSTNNDEVVFSGVYPINNLSEARTMMGKGLRACADDNDLTIDDFLGNDYDKSNSKYRLPDLDNDKTQDGFVNIVTCVNRAGASADYDYVTFGLAVYDIDVTPIAADGVLYINDAQEYANADDPIKAAKDNHVSGVTYDDKTVYSYNYLENKSPQESTTGVSMTTEETEEISSTREDSFEFGMEQEIGADFNIGDKNNNFPSATLHIQQMFHEFWTTMTGKTETKAKQQSRTVTQEVVLPGHTAAHIKQSIGTSNASENYQQPFVLNYKVAIFAMSGDYFNGWGGLISSSRYDKQWLSVLFDGSDAFELNGNNAVSSLYSRAVVNKDVDGYDKTKGKYKSWCDKKVFKAKDKIDWGRIANDIVDDNRDSHYIPNVGGDKGTLQDFATELLFAESGRKLTRDRKSTITVVESLLPYYNLDNVDISKGSKSYDMRGGEKLYLDSIELEGFDKDDVAFYGFSKSWGKWALSDADAENSTENTVNGVRKETTQDGLFTLCTDEQVGSQWVEIERVQNSSDKPYHLRWMLDDTTEIKTYTTMTGSDTMYPDGIMTPEEIRNVITPQVVVNVKSDASDVKSIQVSGSYVGPYDKPINLNQELDVTIKDNNNNLMNVPVYWEDNEHSISVEDSGETHFTRPGKYKVRAYCLKNDEHINSNWIEVTAEEKAELERIGFALPEFDADDLTLTKKDQSLVFDLNSFIKYYDQFDKEWKGTEESPLPKIEFTLSNNEGAEIDEKGNLIVSKKGIYKVTAAAVDENGNILSYTIPPIKLVIDDEDWLDSVEFETPPYGRSDLTLHAEGDQIKIENLKKYLYYYNQKGEEWEGSTPRASFRILEDTDGAEIKGDTFFAYQPGVYTIRPTVTGYEVNDVIIEVTENAPMVITTTDPAKQPINEEGGSVIVDLDKYVNATTPFGGTNKDDIPAMKYTLKNTGGASIGEKKITEDGTKYTIENAFVSDTPGTYIVHVEPKKASEYSKPIDDIEIMVYCNRRVKTVALDFSGIDLDDLVASETWSLDPAEYLVYTDQFGNEITSDELEDFELPDITGYTVDNDFGEDAANARVEKLEDGTFKVTAAESGIFGLIPEVGEEYDAVAGYIALIDGHLSDDIEAALNTLEKKYSELCVKNKDALAAYKKAANEIKISANVEEVAEALESGIKSLSKFRHAAGAPVKKNIQGNSYDEVVYCSICHKELSRVKKTTKPGSGSSKPRGNTNQKGKDGTAVGTGASYATANAAIRNMKSDKDPKGSSFAKLRLKSTKQTRNSIKLSWTRPARAVKYVIYGNKCGKNMKPQKLAEVKGNTWNFKTLNKTRLKKGTYYKLIVVGLDSGNRVVSTSKVIHVATKGGKVGNHKKVTVKSSVVKKAKKLKKGKTLKLKAKAVPQAKRFKVKKHTGIRYESTNVNIATVSGKGVIKAKNRGTCYVYAYAQNGVFKKIKVVVK